MPQGFFIVSIFLIVVSTSCRKPANQANVVVKPVSGYTLEVRGPGGAIIKGQGANFFLESSHPSVALKDSQLTVNGKDYGVIEDGSTILIQEDNQVFVNNTKRLPKDSPKIQEKDKDPYTRLREKLSGTDPILGLAFDPSTHLRGGDGVACIDSSEGFRATQDGLYRCAPEEVDELMKHLQQELIKVGKLCDIEMHPEAIGADKFSESRFKLTYTTVEKRKGFIEVTAKPYTNPRLESKDKGPIHRVTAIWEDIPLKPST